MRAMTCLITCECGEKRDLRYGEEWRCENCGRRWDTNQIPAEQYQAIRKTQLRYRLLPVLYGLTILGLAMFFSLLPILMNRGSHPVAWSLTAFFALLLVVNVVSLGLQARFRILDRLIDRLSLRVEARQLLFRLVERKAQLLCVVSPRIVEIHHLLRFTEIEIEQREVPPVVKSKTVVGSPVAFA